MFYCSIFRHNYYLVINFKNPPLITAIARCKNALPHFMTSEYEYIAEQYFTHCFNNSGKTWCTWAFRFRWNFILNYMTLWSSEKYFLRNRCIYNGPQTCNTAAMQHNTAQYCSSCTVSTVEQHHSSWFCSGIAHICWKCYRILNILNMQDVYYIH